MRRIVTAYLAGISLPLLLPSGLTPVVMAPALAVIALILLARRHWLVFAFLCGYSWAALYAHNYLALAPQPPLETDSVVLSGTVSDWVRFKQGQYLFELTLSNSHAHAWLWSPPRRVLLRIPRRLVELELGALCHLHIRWRQVHASLNPGLPDRGRHWVARHVVAQGRVVPHPANRCDLVTLQPDINGTRRRLSRALKAAIPDAAAAAVMQALALGDRRALTTSQREVMRNTGTAHLLAISGLHVSLCAGVAFFVLRVLLAPLLSLAGVPSVYLAWSGAALAATAYAGLAGFGLPAQRAWLMVVVATACVLSGRRAWSFDALCLSAALLASVDPFAVLNAGSWLSFAAVAVLIMQSGVQRRGERQFRRLLRAHCLLAVGLAPLSALIFGVVPLSGPLCNLLAVPLCAVLIVPVLLLGLVFFFLSPPLFHVAVNTAAGLWRYLFDGLEWVSKFEAVVSFEQFGAAGDVWLLFWAAILLISHAWLRLRSLGVLLLALWWLARSEPINHGDVALTVFDVGQGLAVAVHTQNHNLLYDTGPGWFRSDSDASARIVLPSLARRGIHHLDLIALSHADNDHAGGLESVRTQFPTTPVLASRPQQLAGEVQRCAYADTWRWDGVEFRWLHPEGRSGSDNNQSCVLLIRTPFHRILLTGDIEKDTERLLLNQSRVPTAEVLLVPHHGSRTSSSAEFLHAVAPQIAIVSAGFGNRYGLPHAEVSARYAANGIELINTATDGAISLRFKADQISVQRERHQRFGFWNQAAK